MIDFYGVIGTSGSMVWWLNNILLYRSEWNIYEFRFKLYVLWYARLSGNRYGKLEY